MDKDMREALIKEKQAEIKRLRSEIKDLKGGHIASLTSEKFITEVGFMDGEVYVRKGKSGWSNEWGDLRNLACKLFFIKDGSTLSWHGKDRYHSERRKQDDMTDEQRKAAAEFCDEVIASYNKYVVKVNDFIINGKPYSLKLGGNQ